MMHTVLQNQAFLSVMIDARYVLARGHDSPVLCAQQVSRSTQNC